MNHASYTAFAILYMSNVRSIRRATIQNSYGPITVYFGAHKSTAYRGVREVEWMPGEARIEGRQDRRAVTWRMLPADSESGQSSLNHMMLRFDLQHRALGSDLSPLSARTNLLSIQRKASWLAGPAAAVHRYFEKNTDRAHGKV